MECVVCGGALPSSGGAGRPRRYCSPSCRQRAYRGRRYAARSPDGAVVAASTGPPYVAVLLIPAWPGLGEAIEAVAGHDWTSLVNALANGHDPDQPGPDGPTVVADGIPRPAASSDQRGGPARPTGPADEARPTSPG